MTEELRDASVRAGKALEAARAERAEEINDALARAERAEKAREDALRRAETELDNARIAEEKQRSVEAELSACQLQLQIVTIQARDAGEWAENAEEVARRSDSRAAEMEAAARAAEERAAALEGGITKAMDDYRKTADYEKELAEASAYAYHLGFQDCREKVSRVIGPAGIDDIEPDEASEDSSAGPSPAHDGSAPAAA